MTIVFLSSTFVDLRAHREKVLEAIERLRHVGFDIECRAMERFPASLHERSLEVALRMLDESDWYLGALGPRYGSIPDGYAKSYTEIEYDMALQRDMPRGLFLMDELSSEWERVGPDAQPEKAVKVAVLRERFQVDRNVNYFDSPGDLAMKVVIALIPDVLTERLVAIAEPASRLYAGQPGLRAASMTLMADPAEIIDDGSQVSVIAALLSSEGGRPIDAEPVLWLSAGPGTVNPINTYTVDGQATTVFTPGVQGVGAAWITCIALRSGIAHSTRVDLAPTQSWRGRGT